ncbi:cytochrome-450 hydroxylase [Mycena metata]|uniref:Cytochrome-450 hydroxylase n=1 Tax=Mycena metata TaxID=1033252 RepID=A0AAD7KCY8_9AGAR|nr:cytochrome-450 hydroxylase [Mycena metata]
MLCRPSWPFSSTFSYQLVVAPRFNVLRNLPGPPVPTWFGNHLQHVLNPTVTPKVYDIFVKRYGRSVRIRGLGPWDERLPHSRSLYEKPWQSRALITSLIGCQVHKRQRRVALPAFSGQNMRSLSRHCLRDAWVNLLPADSETASAARIDVCQFLSRVTFDVVGLAASTRSRDETNELFVAYRDMFEVAISQGSAFRTLLSIYLPRINRLFPDKTVRTLDRCREVIHRVAGSLIQDKKQKIAEGEKSGDPYDGKDLLTLLLKSNTATDLPPEHRISDDDILNNINTFHIQDRLRAELLSIAPEGIRDLSELTEDQVQSLHTALSALPLLHNVTRESLRLIPPLHSTLRVATQDDEVPTLEKHSFTVPRGTFVHLSVEAFNLDKAVWGEDAWEFNPDRWDNLPEAAQRYPWHFSSILSFSAGPRACPGLRFALIEIKTIYYILLTNFVFRQTEDEITRHNVVLTRPYLKGKFKDGTQCPLLVSRFTPS